MKNKVINIMPDTPKAVLFQCNQLAEHYPNSIYKIFLGFPLLFPRGEEFRPIVLIIFSGGILFFTKHRHSVDSEEVFLRGKLLQYDFLRSKTELRFSIVPIIYSSETDVFAQSSSIISKKTNFPALDIETMRYIESALTGMLTKRNQESVSESANDDSLLGEIKRINYNIATFDSDQYRCIEARSDSKITAIRGLAGCGKTVVLCKIAANEIYRNPNARVCYTYQTRSMYGQVKARIKEFLISSGMADVEAAMERIDIMGAWGGYDNPGLLNNVCHKLELTALDLEEARFYNFSNPFLGFCDYVNKHLPNESLELYDYILVDEAQDLNQTFLRMCLKFLTREGKLIYAYDDFQTLSEVSLPSPDSIFSQEDSVNSFPLSVCYRTPPKTLSLAHAISMGIYSDPPTFYQFPADPKDWSAMGYLMEKGEGKVGQETVLSRTSPDFYGGLSSSAVKSVSPKNGESMFCMLARLLRDDLSKGLEPEDILIVDLDGANLDSDYQFLKTSLDELENEDESDEFNPKVYFAGSMNPNSFRRKGYITFSGIKRAKGNEAFQVYLINASKAMSKQFSIVWRNRLFTAMTRTRLHLVFVNSADQDQQNLRKELFDEMKQAREKDYKLVFSYPSPREIKKIIETAKTEERIMGEAETIATKLKQVEKAAGGDKMLDLLKEVINSSMSRESKEKLLQQLSDDK